MTGFRHELSDTPWPGYDDGRPHCRCPVGGRDPDGSEYVCEVCEDRYEWLDFCALAEAHEEPADNDQPPFDGKCSVCGSDWIELVRPGRFFCPNCGSASVAKDTPDA